MNAKIIEIFRSIQGEGKYAGAAQVFVRLFECNMHCTWCDTPASIGDTSRKYKDMTLAEVNAAVNALYPGCHSVSITGGEPLLQADFLKELCQAMHKQGKRIYLDSNGTLPQELKKIISYIDIIAMDIKLPSSTKQREFWQEHREFLRMAMRKEVFIKTVVSTTTSDADILKAARLVAAVDPRILFVLQPNYLELKKGLVEQCVAWQKKCAKILKDVRILPQAHKFMKIR